MTPKSFVIHWTWDALLFVSDQKQCNTIPVCLHVQRWGVTPQPSPGLPNHQPAADLPAPSTQTENHLRCGWWYRPQCGRNNKSRFDSFEFYMKCLQYSKINTIRGAFFVTTSATSDASQVDQSPGTPSSLRPWTFPIPYSGTGAYHQPLNWSPYNKIW